MGIEEYLPVGTRVRCESEWKPGKWDYGTVALHRLNSFGETQWIGIQLDDDPPGSVLTEYDYRYLDAENPRNSLVRKVANSVRVEV